MKIKSYVFIAAFTIALQCSADSYGIQHWFVYDGGPGCILHWEASRTVMTGTGLWCTSPITEGPFTIYRDGEEIAVVRNSTWFRDMDTVAGRSYSYRVAGYGRITDVRTVTCPMSYSVSVESSSCDLPWRGGKSSIRVTGLKQQWTDVHYSGNTSVKDGNFYLLETPTTWTAEPDSSWIRLVGCNSAGKVSSNGSAGLDLEILENQTGAVRTGRIIVKCEGVEVKSIQIAQAARPAEIIPQLGAGDGADHVRSAVASIGFADSEVANLIGGDVVAYSNFRTWAQGVEGGEEAVVASPKAAVSYRLGAKRLFTQTPKIKLGDVATERFAAKRSAGVSMTVSVVVMDGVDAVEVASEKVAAMFEATSDLSDWTGAAKLTPTVEVLEGDRAAMRFRVTPGDGTATRAFLRIRKLSALLSPARN